MSSLPPGSRIEGFEIVGLLGKGGMAEVYRARQVSLNRHVALKLMAEDGSSGDQYRARFQREAEILVSLDHPNLVKVLDAGVVQGRRFLVLDLVEGLSLEQQIARGAPLPLAFVQAVLLNLAQALVYLHQQRVVHRDLKPANVLVSHDGDVKVVDFGLARSGMNTALTGCGQFVGTVRYISPEAVLGLDVAPPADVYGLGLIAFEMLTGQLPYDASDTAQWLAVVVGREPIRLRSLVPQVPPDWSDLVSRMLDKDPGRRPTAPELVGTLETMEPGGEPSPRRLERIHELESSFQSHRVQAKAMTVARARSGPFSRMRPGLLLLPVALVIGLATSAAIHRMRSSDPVTIMLRERESLVRSGETLRFHFLSNQPVRLGARLRSGTAWLDLPDEDRPRSDHSWPIGPEEACAPFEIHLRTKEGPTLSAGVLRHPGILELLPPASGVLGFRRQVRDSLQERPDLDLILGDLGRTVTAREPSGSRDAPLARTARAARELYPGVLETLPVILGSPRVSTANKREIFIRLLSLRILDRILKDRGLGGAVLGAEKVMGPFLRMESPVAPPVDRGILVVNAAQEARVQLTVPPPAGSTVARDLSRERSSVIELLPDSVPVRSASTLTLELDRGLDSCASTALRIYLKDVQPADLIWVHLNDWWLLIGHIGRPAAGGKPVYIHDLPPGVLVPGWNQVALFRDTVSPQGWMAPPVLVGTVSLQGWRPVTGKR